MKELRLETLLQFSRRSFRNLQKAFLGCQETINHISYGAITETYSETRQPDYMTIFKKCFVLGACGRVLNTPLNITRRFVSKISLQEKMDY